MSAAVPVSVLILTLNEAANIERCIRALDWCGDIVVLDSFSSDGTLEQARVLGARVFQRAFDNFAAQRNYALDHIEFKHEWILHLDADEVVTVALRDEIATVAVQGRHSAFQIPSKLIFGERWLRFSGMYPVYQVRLGRRDKLRFQQVGHGQREVVAGGAIGTLHEPYLHYGLSKGLADWLERHNRYSSDEARLELQLRDGLKVEDLFSFDRTRRRRALKALAPRLPMRPLLRFLYMYVVRLGCLDGRAGWTYCRMLAMYEYWIVLKQRELRKAAGARQ